ncbi:hypothetical protein C8R43DRAFT_1116111 [Mycena crocata]|nr:hypothetical protein C8R43DRAFT_1116111 [Mycena crocata]
MRFAPAFSILCTVVVAALAAPSDNTTILRRDSLTCGTAGNAVLSFFIPPRCAPWLTVFPSPHRICDSGHAMNPVCSPGNCCFYTTRKSRALTVDDVKKYGNMILACGDTSKNKVNGRVEDSDRNKYCLSNGSGCTDCL